jgi:hypothetical protein
MLYKLTDDELRSLCREKLESLEYWLRRLIDEKLSASYGDYFSHVDAVGNRLIKKSIVETLEERLKKEPDRYTRKIDAVLLSDAIDVICNPTLFGSYFREPLKLAFPEGREEARTFMYRLLDPRNRLAHANPISVRQAEQVICYSNDIIESLKSHYSEQGMSQEYNVPLILKITDSFGNVFHRSQLQEVSPSGETLKRLDAEPNNYLWPGDTLTVEVEVDPAFDPAEYSISWRFHPSASETVPDGPRAMVHITPKHVSVQFAVTCTVASNKEWHRMGRGVDDKLHLIYKVLPPR